MRFSETGVAQFYYFLAIFSILSAFSAGCAQAADDELQPDNASSYAFYYGRHPPIAELQAFDKVVVDPDSSIRPNKINSPRTEWLAYVSVGEVAPSRAYAKAIPQEWLLGKNTIWNGKVIDQSAAGWPAFFVENVITPLWKRGFHGFFLDTLDSYQLVVKTPQALAQQQAGLVAVITAIKARYPDASLVFNRGFEILPQVENLVSAVVLESLYSGWDQAGKHYTEVPENDRQWLLGQVRIIQEKYRLPVIAIDYCAPGDRVCAETTASRIAKLGVRPYVTDGALQTVGTGAGVDLHRILRPQSLKISD